MDSLKLDILKIGFAWYMLFETDCNVDELRFMTSKNYNSGYITSDKEMTYEVPQKYFSLFEHLEGKEYDGFKNLAYMINKLGNMVNINKLTPMVIKKTRTENIMRCSNCGTEYTNQFHNWSSVNNRIICIKCADDLKKNETIDVVVNEITNEDVEIGLTDVEKLELSSILFTFDELREKALAEEIDYIKLHEFQIKIGKLGEAYVYKQECLNLKDTKYAEMVDDTPAKDPINGYDILSYERDGTALYIEVKTTASRNEPFFLTSNEYLKAQEMKADGKKYLIYRVENILAKNENDIGITVIEDITTNSDYKLVENGWKVTKVC